MFGFVTCVFCPHYCMVHSAGSGPDNTTVSKRSGYIYIAGASQLRLLVTHLCHGFTQH